MAKGQIRGNKEAKKPKKPKKPTVIKPKRAPVPKNMDTSTIDLDKALIELDPRRKKAEAPVGFEALMAQQLNAAVAPGVASEASAETGRVQGILAPTLLGQVDLGYAAQPEQPVLARAGARLEDIFSSFEAFIKLRALSDKCSIYYSSISSNG